LFSDSQVLLLLLLQSLSLGSLGSKLRSSWQPHEELLFTLGM
jgi:hypothetical protein